jgi:DNA repair exonuclease SbcCD ATPase subunit
VKIKQIEIENILSIEKMKLSFEDNGLILVEGWNHDAERANGAGKTAIFNALAFALYDKVPRKITASEILRRGAKSGKVRVSLECGKDVWTVERSRPKGVAFYRGQVRTEITQEEWENNLRLTYNQFLMSMYCAQNTDSQQPRFLLTPDTDKKKLLLQL